MRGLFCKPTTPGAFTIAIGSLSHAARPTQVLRRPPFDRLLRKVLPGDVLPQQFCVAPAIDDAIAHHARARNIVPANQRLATMTRDSLRVRILLFRNRPAQPGRHIVIPRIPRAKQNDPFVDHQRHAAAQLQRPRQKCILRPAGFQLDGLPLLAAVHRLLNTKRVRLALVQVRERRSMRSEPGSQHSAGRWNFRHSHRASVLSTCLEKPCRSSHPSQHPRTRHTRKPNFHNNHPKRFPDSLAYRSILVAIYAAARSCLSTLGLVAAMPCLVGSGARRGVGCIRLLPRVTPRTASVRSRSKQFKNAATT